MAGTPEEIKNWAPIVGEWEFREFGLARYQVPPPDQRPFGICVSGLRFSEGEAITTIQLPGQGDEVPKDASGRILLGYRSPNDSYTSVGLGGYAAAFVISSFEPLRGWAAISLAGSYRNLRPDHPYRLKVRVRGQNVVLEVDDIRVLRGACLVPL